MSEITYEFVDGLTARAIDPESVLWPPDSLVQYAKENDEIVGRIGLIELPHLEGTFVAEHKRGSSLAFRLLKGMEDKVASLGRTHLFAFVEDSKPEQIDMLERTGYVRFPVTVLAKRLAVKDESELVSKQLDWIQRGIDFHEKLFALYPDDGHADDIEHYKAVGRSLSVAFDEGDPERAMSLYNDYIAAGALYEGASLVSFTADAATIDMGQHGQIEVKSDGSMRRLEVVCP